MNFGSNFIYIFQPSKGWNSYVLCLTQYLVTLNVLASIEEWPRYPTLLIICWFWPVVVPLSSASCISNLWTMDSLILWASIPFLHNTLWYRWYPQSFSHLLCQLRYVYSILLHWTFTYLMYLDRLLSSMRSLYQSVIFTLIVLTETSVFY